MGGVTSNCNKNYSDRKTYSDKYSIPTNTTRSVATFAGSSNNNKPEVVRATVSRNRSASVGDDVTGSCARMATNRRPQDGVTKTPEENRHDVCTWSMRTAAAAGNNMAGVRSGIGAWGSGRVNPSRNSSLRSDTSRSSSPRYTGYMDSPGSGSRNTGSSRGRCYWGGGVQRNSDTQLDFTGSDVTTPTSSSPRKHGGGATGSAVAAPPRSRATQRRSSISFLPAEASFRESALGRLPVGNASRGGAVSPMEKVNFSLGNATDLMASLIGGTASSGSGGGLNSQSKHEDSFWVPPAVWRKKRAQSLVPQKPSVEEDALHEGTIGEKLNLLNFYLN